MNPRRTLLAAAPLGVAAVILLTAGPAAGYARTRTDNGSPVQWQSPLVEILAYNAAPPTALTPDSFLNAARGAADTWSHGVVVCPAGGTTALRLAVSPVAQPRADATNDKRNRLTFRTVRWCQEPKTTPEICYPSAALAITTVTAEIKNGNLLDADVEVNAVTFTWDDLVANPQAVGSVQDIQNTLTHEFGHLIGMDHNCHSGEVTWPIDDQGKLVPECKSVPSDSPLREATMFASVAPGDIKRRTLDADDVRAVCEVYPVGSGNDGGGGCSVMLPRPRACSAASLLLAAWAFAAARLRRRGIRSRGTGGCRSSVPDPTTGSSPPTP